MKFKKQNLFGSNELQVLRDTFAETTETGIIDLSEAILKKLYKTVEDVKLPEGVTVEMAMDTALRTASNIVNGIIVSPLRGTDDEWENEWVGKANEVRVMSVTMNDTDYEIPYTVIERNVRIPGVMRLNRSNDTVFDTSAIIFNDIEREEDYITPMSQRFIEFPYIPNPLKIMTNIFGDPNSNEASMEVLDPRYDDLNRMVMLDDEGNILILPLLPMGMMSDLGYSIEDEVNKLVESLTPIDEFSTFINENGELEALEDDGPISFNAISGIEDDEDDDEYIEIPEDDELEELYRHGALKHFIDLITSEYDDFTSKYEEYPSRDEDENISKIKPYMKDMLRRAILGYIFNTSPNDEPPLGPSVIEKITDNIINDLSFLEILHLLITGKIEDYKSFI